MWVKPTTILTTDDENRQALFCLGDMGLNSDLTDDEHALAAYLVYDPDTDEGKLEIIIATENIAVPMKSISKSFFGNSTGNKWMFIGITYKNNDAGQSVLRAYAQTYDGALSIADNSGLPQQILNQYSSFAVNGSLSTGMSSFEGYLGRALTDAVNENLDPEEDVPVFPFNGYIDGVIVDSVEYSEASIAELFKGMGSALVTLANQSIYAEDGTGALNPVYETYPNDEPFTRLRFLVSTGNARGGIYKAIESSYDSEDETIDITLAVEPGMPDLDGIAAGDIIAVAPIYPGEDGRLTSITPGLVYSDKIVYDDATEFDYYEGGEAVTLSEGDWVPMGVPITIDYKSSSDIETIQDYVDSELNRTITSGNLIKYVNPVLVNFDAVITSSSNDETTLAYKEDGIKNFIDNIPKGGTLELSDIINKFYELGCDYVQQPLTVEVEVRDSAGRLYTETVSDKFTLNGSQAFLGNDITVTNL